MDEYTIKQVLHLIQTGTKVFLSFRESEIEGEIIDIGLNGLVITDDGGEDVYIAFDTIDTAHVKVLIDLEDL